MKRNRVLLGLSVREAAEKAGISKNTVLRLESGLPVQRASITKLSRAYGMVPTEPDSRVPPKHEGRSFRLHTNAEAVWYATRLNAKGEAEAYTNPEVQSEAERNRLGRYGLVNHFGRPLRCRRESSRLIPFLIEPYGPTDITADPSGERFLYVLRGRMRVHVGAESFVIESGEAATYDATLPHYLEPTDSVTPESPAPLALQIVLP